MDSIFYIIAGPLFLISVAAHIYVRIRLRPKENSDLDDYYHELEEQHPQYARYTKWLNVTFTAIAISILLLFVALAI